MITDKKLFELLDWNSSKEAQEEGIRIGLQRQNLEFFYKPMIREYGKIVQGY